MTRLVAQLITCHRTDTLRPLFESLRAQTHGDWELHWLDSGSSPEEYAEMLRIASEAAPGLRMKRERRETNVNFAAGHQALYAAHDAPHVALVNDDAILAPDYFARLSAALDARPDLSAVSGTVLRWERAPGGGVALTNTVDSLGLKRTPWQAVSDIGAGQVLSAAQQAPGGIQIVFGVSGCLPMYRRSAVGPLLFEPSYVFYKEDVDLAYRLRRASHLAATVQGARAWHLRSLKPGLAGRGRDKHGYRRLFYSYRNHLWNLRRNLTWQDWLVYGWCIVPYEIAKAAYLLLTHPTIIWRVLRGNPA